MHALRAAAAKCADLPAIAAAVGVTVEDLAKVLEERPRLAAAFERGRLLRHVRGLSQIGSSYEEAARTLGRDPDEFRKAVEGDPELADLWLSARVATTQSLRVAQVSQAMAGNAAAVKAVLERLEADTGSAGLNLRAVRVNETAEVFGVTRQTIHAWATTGQCPRNADGSFPLRELIEWRIGQRIAATGGARGEPDHAQRLQAARAESAEMDLLKARGELLDRRAVVAGLVARAWAIVNKLQGAEIRLAADVQGKPAALVAEIVGAWMGELRAAAATADLAALRLPAELARDLGRLLARVAAIGGAA